jgi:beta-mannosidase
VPIVADTGGDPLDRALSWRAAPADEALRRHYPDPAFDDSSWTSVSVPGHWRSEPAFAASDGPLLYRAPLDLPSPRDSSTDSTGGSSRERMWLVIDGVMYTSDVWLDGTYLGDTEGYFFPHAFEITEQVDGRSEHLLALEVACPPPVDLTAKRALTGVFQHWDLLDQTWNPGGIWRPPRIEQTGPVRIKHFRALCREANETSAVIFVRAVLDATEACTVDLVTTVGLESPESGASADDLAPHHNRQPLAAGENRVEWTMTIESPRLWWPWSLGAQPLYLLTCAVELDGAGGASDERSCRIGLRSVTANNWIFSVNGERLFLKGSNQGPTRMALAEATDDELAADVALARSAGLDFLRVHAHVSRPALYDAADEAGVLLWQDLPLQWGYARSVRKPARRQAREAVDLLAHHPSIFVWCGHNEPFAMEVTPERMADPKSRAWLVAKGALSTVLPTWNKTVLDHSIKRVLDKCDGSRPVVPHSGVFPHPPQFDGTDTHTYFGWYNGQFRQFATLMMRWPRLARFVTEFGAQAVPDDAPWLHPERWPDLDWDEAYERFALQKPFFDQHVAPADHPTYDGWVLATQRYQGEVIKFHIETLRRLKYSPCGGFAQFCLADGYPSVTWSVLDAGRRPKLGYAVVRNACRPVIVVADWLPARLAPSESVALDVHVVNDERIALSDMVVRAHLRWREEGGDGRSGEHVWGWTGDAGADGVVRVGTIQAQAPSFAAGRVSLDLELTGHDATGADLLVTNHYETSVSSRVRR